MTFREYIRRMDDQEFAAFLVHVSQNDDIACGFCSFFGVEHLSCSACERDREQSCIKAMQELLDHDIEHPVFSDFFSSYIGVLAIQRLSREESSLFPELQQPKEPEV